MPELYGDGGAQATASAAVSPAVQAVDRITLSSFARASSFAAVSASTASSAAAFAVAAINSGQYQDVMCVGSSHVYLGFVS